MIYDYTDDRAVSDVDSYDMRERYHSGDREDSIHNPDISMLALILYDYREVLLFLSWMMLAREAKKAHAR